MSGAPTISFPLVGTDGGDLLGGTPRSGATTIYPPLGQKISTAEVGQDFVSGVGRDLQDLQQEVRDTCASLRTALEREATARQLGLSATHDRIEELKRRLHGQANEQDLARQQLLDLEQRAKAWVCALGASGKSVKERLQSLETGASDLARQASASERRISQVEADMGLKCSSAALEELAATLGFVREGQEQDHGVTVMVQTRLEDYRKVSEAALRNFSALLASTTSELHRYAKSSEVQVVDAKLSSLVNSVQLATEDLARKASSGDVDVLSNRVSNLSGQLKASIAQHHARQNELEQVIHAAVAAEETGMAKLQQEDAELRARSCGLAAELDELKDQLKAALGKLERRQDTDCQRFAAAGSALEKEIGRARGEVKNLGPRVVAAEGDIKVLLQTIRTKVELEDHKRLRGRAEALEAAVIKKAEAETVAQQGNAVADHVAKHSAADKRHVEHEERIDRHDTFAEETRSRLDEVEHKAREMMNTLHGKADQSDVHPKQSVETLLSRYYNKDEIDGMLGRVWWRVGDLKSTGVKTLLSSKEVR